MREALDRLKRPPALVITDSQAFLKVAADTPPESLLTSFSILFARFKGDLLAQVQGTLAIEDLRPGDRVLVARSSAGAINKTQFTLNGAHSAATTVTVNEALGNDIPDSGNLRLSDTAFTYTGINRPSKQFTGVSPALTGSGGATLYNPYIDGVASGTSMSKSFVYASDFDIIARVRKKGIYPFENSATVTNAGAAVSAIRTTDTIVQ